MSRRLGHGSASVLDRSALSKRSRDPLAVTGHVNRTSQPARALHSYAVFVCSARSWSRTAR